MNPAKRAYSYLSNFIPCLQELPIKNLAVCSCTPGGGMGSMLRVVPCRLVLQLVLGGLWLLCLGEVEEIPCICSFRGGMYLTCAMGTGLYLYSRQEWRPEDYQKSIAFIFVCLDVFNKWRSQVTWMLEKWKALNWHFPFKRAGEDQASNRQCSPNVLTLCPCTSQPGITLSPVTHLALSVHAEQTTTMAVVQWAYEHWGGAWPCSKPLLFSLCSSCVFPSPCESGLPPVSVTWCLYQT